MQRIGAFFDLDGTLLPGPSLELRFVRFLRMSGEIDFVTGLRWFGQFVRQLFAWKRAGIGERWTAAMDGNKAHLAGLKSSCAESFLGELSLEPLEFFREALQRVAWHVAQDHVVCLVTGSLAPLALCAAWRLATQAAKWASGMRPKIYVCATQLEEPDGHWTGEVEGEAVVGTAKARAIETFASKHEIDLQRSYAYGDRWSDRAMLASVGHATAVNPSAALEGAARLRGWGVVGWAECEASGEERKSEVRHKVDAPTAHPRASCAVGAGERDE
jgi:putative phosphoserine phosphatase/1-acylglycerol-3-phosphate O-acyltransferase